MPDSENKPQKKGLLPLILLPLGAVLLLAVPYILAPFNDGALARLRAAFPSREAIGGFTGEVLLQRAKSPYDLVFMANQRDYAPYEEVEFRLAVAHRKTGAAAPDLKPLLSLGFQDGSPLADIFGDKEFKMNYDPAQKNYVFRWFSDNPALSGTVRAEVALPLEAFSPPLRESLQIRIRRPAPEFRFGAPSVFLGLDFKELLAQRSILSLGNKEAPISALAEWLPLLNVDGVFLQGALSKTYGLKENQIWDEEKLKESESLARNFARAGVRSGLIVQLLQVEGIEIARLGYKETKYGGSSSYFDRSVISLDDPLRPAQLREMLSSLQKNEAVSYVGLSRMFYGGGYHEELRPLFRQEFSGRDNASAFEKWKRYRAAAYLRNLIGSVGGSKPYFAFISEDEWEAVPGILDMAFAAGVDFAVLDLKPSAKNKALMDEQFKGLADGLRHHIVFSYQMNYGDFIGESSSAVEAWQDQSLEALSRGGFRSFYISDLYKALFGRRGPYPAYEWMLAAAELSSQWKEPSLPLSQKIVPNAGFVSPAISLAFEIKNRGEGVLSNVTVSLMPTVDLEKQPSSILTILSLRSGESFRTNILLANISFKASVLQRRTRFLALHTAYRQGAESFSRMELLPFIDPSVEPDRLEQNLVVTNTALQPSPAPSSNIIQEETPPEPPRQDRQQRAEAPVELPPVAETPEPSVETQKLSFLERQRLKRLEQQAKKAAEEKD